MSDSGGRPGLSGIAIVGVGASAGGLDAFRFFFDHMPADSGMAFIILLHLPADRKSMLPDIVGRWTSMPVREGVDGVAIEPDVVYVPPPHSLVGLANGRLSIRKAVAGDKFHRPIDDFFGALASALGEQAIGVILSGTGNDGALGLKAIKERGGLTIAQGTDGTAPQYAEMPEAAVATGAVDLVAPVDEIPAHLIRLRGRAAPAPAPASGQHSPEDQRLEICAILRSQLGHDFSGYRDQTFLRRVQRRMQVVDAASLDAYIGLLRRDHDEVALLFRDLLIRVTSFFRDKDTFEALETKVIPQLFAGKGADGRVRLWIPGCATGEEAYSLAILLREYMDKLAVTGVPKVQIFATDIDESAIATARLGRYPPTLLDGLSETPRERFFQVSHGSCVVSKAIRELCTFSAHNVVRDPPFSGMDLVSCRNLLIYLNQELQGRLIPVFHYALVRGGILLLGGSESASQQAALFEPLDKAARIFRRRDVRSPPLHLRLEAPAGYSKGPYAGDSFPRDVDGGAVREHGNRPQRTATGDGEAVSPSVVDRRAAPAEPSPEMSISATVRAFWQRLGGGPGSTAALRQDLQTTQERLQSLGEEHQTALEELRSSNEELHSVNEEMQSTNEELETSKEELQSLNEELHTVNVRLTEKLDELDAANGDLRNLFESTEIATLFLDRRLIIRSFTPAIAALYNLIPSDVGRPVTDISSRVAYDRLREDVDDVLATRQPLERRVSRTDAAAHYMMRILPYRETDSSISGVLVTFVDITNIVSAEQALVDADNRKDVFLATLSHELRNPLAPIRTAARLLETKSLDPAQLERAQSIISRQVSHMSSLLDDLLDVSRITRGACQLKRAPVAVGNIIESALEAVQSAVDAKGHALRVEMPDERILLDVDAVRLTQVLSNLLMNAVKYTPKGGHITLSCRRGGEGVQFAVRDDGVGVAPDMLPRIFTMFTRASAAEGGLGIGLALARGLVELHGGTLEATSQGEGRGCEFVVSLPQSAIVASALSAASSHSADGNGVLPRRLLIVDDNRDGAESLALFMQMHGHDVHVAHSGQEALVLAETVHPEVAVIDIGMPQMNGYEVAHRIRQAEWGGAVTLVALTGWGQQGDKDRAFAAGFDQHCTKPIDPEVLERYFIPRAG